VPELDEQLFLDVVQSFSGITSVRPTTCSASPSTAPPSLPIVGAVRVQNSRLMRRPH
jgi:hypothetical protein